MKVLVAIDGSRHSKPVLDAICKRRWEEDTEFRIVHVLEPIGIEEMDLTKWSDTLEGAHVVRQKEAEKVCSRAREILISGVPGSIVHYEIRGGDPKVQILDSAAQWPADRIMVGSHGSGLCPHFLLGSVSRTVARHANCSVEIVKMKTVGGAKRQELLDAKDRLPADKKCKDLAVLA